MIKKYSKKFVDECKRDNITFITKESLGAYNVKVIDYGSKNRYCTIQINDWEAEVQVVNLKKGVVKYPFHPSVFGHGYLGVGDYKPKIMEMSYVKNVTYKFAYDMTKYELNNSLMKLFSSFTDMDKLKGTLYPALDNSGLDVDNIEIISHSYKVVEDLTGISLIGTFVCN